MDHHFYHMQAQKQQAHVENVIIKKRPNTALVMKQFYKPGDRPKSSLQQHKLLEWKCECGEQLYVNKVMNLNISNTANSKGFQGKKIELHNSNLIKKMKGNDTESKMKFKEMSYGSKISPYDILMEKYVNLKQQEEQQISLMNYSNPYDQLQYQNYPTHYPFNPTNQVQPTQQYEQQQNYSLTNQDYNQNNNFNRIPEQDPQQYQSYQQDENKQNQLRINLAPQNENNYHQEEQFEEDQHNQSNEDNIHYFQRQLSQKSAIKENEGIENECNVEEEIDEDQQNESQSQEVHQNISQYNTSEQQIQNEEEQEQQQENSLSQHQEEQEQVQEQQQQEIAQIDGSDSNRMVQYMQYQQVLLDQKNVIGDQSVEEYPESNRFDLHEGVNQFEQDEKRVLDQYEKQQKEQQLQQYKFQQTQQQAQQQQQLYGTNSELVQNAKKQRVFSAVTRKEQPQSVKVAQQMNLNNYPQLNNQNQMHEINYSIDNVSILSAKKQQPKRPQTSKLIRPLNFNFDAKQVLPLKRVGSAQTSKNDFPSGLSMNKFLNKQMVSLPNSAKNQIFQGQQQDDLAPLDYIYTKQFHRPSSFIKNSSFYNIQQRKKSVGQFQIPNSGQNSAKMSGSIKNLFQQPLINDLGKQVNIRSVKQLHHTNQQGLSQTFTGPFRENTSQLQNINTQTEDQYDLKSNHMFITNPTHFPFKVKNLVSSDSQQQFPFFNQSSKNTTQRPYTSNPYKRI